jgi:hypothetical protein
MEPRSDFDAASTVLACFVFLELLALTLMSLVWLPSLSEMLGEFTTRPPLVARLAMSRAFLPATALVIIGTTLVGIRHAAWRTRGFAAAFVLGALSIAFAFYAAMAPLSTLAGAIKAE